MEELQNVLERELGLSQEQSRVADIAFAFNNRNMLKLLRKRYKYLRQAKFDKAEEIETQMTALKDDKYEQLVVPNTMYVTFMEGIAQQESIDKGVFVIAGERLKMKNAKSPSDIMWMNRGVSKRSQIWRGIFVVFFVLTVTVALYLIFTIEVQYKIYINYRAHPPGVICADLYDTYTEKQVRFLAGIEYMYLDERESYSNDLNTKIS